MWCRCIHHYHVEVWHLSPCSCRRFTCGQLCGRPPVFIFTFRFFAPCCRSCRLDTTLIDFTDMKCQRGDLSFIFNGNAVPSESFVVLDNEQKVYQRIHHEVCEAAPVLFIACACLCWTSSPFIPGVGDGDGGGSGHPDEQRRLLCHTVHQVHNFLQGTDWLAVQRGQDGGCSRVASAMSGTFSRLSQT